MKTNSRVAALLEDARVGVLGHGPEVDRVVELLGSHGATVALAADLRQIAMLAAIDPVAIVFGVDVSSRQMEERLRQVARLRWVSAFPLTSDDDRMDDPETDEATRKRQEEHASLLRIATDIRRAMSADMELRRAMLQNKDIALPLDGLGISRALRALPDDMTIVVSVKSPGATGNIRVADGSIQSAEWARGGESVHGLEALTSLVQMRAGMLYAEPDDATRVQGALGAIPQALTRAFAAALAPVSSTRERTRRTSSRPRMRSAAPPEPDSENDQTRPLRALSEERAAEVLKAPELAGVSEEAFQSFEKATTDVLPGVRRGRRLSRPAGALEAETVTRKGPEFEVDSNEIESVESLELQSSEIEADSSETDIPTRERPSLAPTPAISAEPVDPEAGTALVDRASGEIRNGSTPEEIDQAGDDVSEREPTAPFAQKKGGGLATPTYDSTRAGTPLSFRSSRPPPAKNASPSTAPKSVPPKSVPPKSVPSGSRDSHPSEHPVALKPARVPAEARAQATLGSAKATLSPIKTPSGIHDARSLRPGERLALDPDRSQRIHAENGRARVDSYAAIEEEGERRGWLLPFVIVALATALGVFAWTHFTPEHEAPRPIAEASDETPNESAEPEPSGPRVVPLGPRRGEEEAAPSEVPAFTATGPAATEPAPTETAPENAPTAPTEPASTEPAPTEPAPTEPAPTEPAPTEPAPTETAPTEPAPTEPAPTETAPPETEPATPEPASETSALPRPLIPSALPSNTPRSRSTSDARLRGCLRAGMPLPCLVHAYEADFGNPHICAAFARTLAQQGRWEEAEAWAEKAVQLRRRRQRYRDLLRDVQARRVPPPR